MHRRFAAAAAAVALSACAPRLPAVPANVVSPAAIAGVHPTVSTPDAPPRIQAILFSTLSLRRGSQWSGRIVAPTNTASVEVRTNLFSIDVPRTSFGRFAFQVDVLDLPPIFVRSYILRVIARNSAGAEAEEDLPFDIR